MQHTEGSPPSWAVAATLQVGEDSHQLYSSSHNSIADVLVAAGTTLSRKSINDKVKRMLNQDLGQPYSFPGIAGDVVVSFKGQ